MTIIQQNTNNNKKMNDNEEMIMGFYVYRIITPSRFACSLIPSGAIGIMEGLSIKIPTDTPSPESPMTVIFNKPLHGSEIQWSSDRKCFVCNSENPKMILL